MPPSFRLRVPTVLPSDVQRPRRKCDRTWRLSARNLHALNAPAAAVLAPVAVRAARLLLLDDALLLQRSATDGPLLPDDRLASPSPCDLSARRTS